jgi:hypothetical protein
MLYYSNVLLHFMEGNWVFSIFFHLMGEKLDGESNLIRVILGFLMTCKWLGCEFNKFIGSMHLVNHR